VWLSRRDSDSGVGSSDDSSGAPSNRVRHASTQTTEATPQEICGSNQIGAASPSQEPGEAGTYSAQARDIPTAAYPSTSSETSVASLDGNSVKCPICLVAFSADQVATPDTCDHFFCVGCLEEWSSKVNTCPLDREEYKVILARHYPDGELIRRIPLPPRIVANDLEDILLPDIIVCSICFRHDLEGATFRSFDCDHSYHIECLADFMGSTPINEWFCSVCAAAATYELPWSRQRED
jgi:PHD and RING finger domain-containing protein 1